MHVVSCQVRDVLRIGRSVRVEVLEVAEDRVRLGITSPQQSPAYREQVIFFGGGDGFGSDDGHGEGDETEASWLQLAEA